MRLLRPLLRRCRRRQAKRGLLLRDQPPLNWRAMLGDMILAHGVCLREAAEKGISDQAHTSHLIVHGLLHLAGYDHETGEAEAEEMEALERKALALLGMPDPYA